jgi:TonB-dependent SusC/RagA subfamily outer membrane receptor
MKQSTGAVGALKWSARLLLALVLGANPLLAQQTGTVSGTVVDAATMQPLNGAQVVVGETGRGALTDARGRFLVAGVPAGTHAVRVSNLGYRSSTRQLSVGAGETAAANFSLEISAVALDEVVVTGTAGAVEKRKIGSSMATVDVSRVQEVTPVTSMGQALESRVPGIRSVAPVGGVGAARDLRIRGTSSFSLGVRPVIYIDGLRVDNTAAEWAGSSVSGGTCCSFSGGAGEDRLSDLNPEDIDRIEILKGAAAATLYGSEASNGVIQIFTKRGRNNSKPTFSFSSSVGFNRHRENFATTLYPNFTGPDGTRALDANEALIENGLINNYDLTVQGGGQDVTYFISGGYGFEEGSIKPNWQKSGNLRMNLRWLASDKWSFDLNSAFARNNILALQSGNNWTALYGNAILGNPLKASKERPFGEPWTAIEDIRAIQAFSNANRWTGGFTANFQPTSNFSQRITAGLDNVTDQKERILPFGASYVYLGEQGERSIGYRSSNVFTLDYLGNFGLDLTPSIVSDFSFGAQGFWETEEISNAIGQGFAGPGVTTVGGGSKTFGDEFFKEAISIGLFAQNRFSIHDKLFATLGIRVDGNSAFGVNYGLQPYPKADVAYVLSEEGFMPQFISNLKVRAAVGTSGLPPGAYDQFQTYNPTAVLGDVPGVTPANPGNPNLEPEKTTEIEAGFDMGLFEDKVGVEFTAYRAITRDALLRVALPPSMGFGLRTSDQQWRNAGEILNEGWELSINTSPVVTPRFRWNTQLNFDGNRNEILDLGPAAIDGRLGNHRVGKPVNSLWGQVITGFNPETNKHTRSDTSVYIGAPLPTFNASMGNTVSFGPFRVFGLVSVERGAWFSNGDRPYRIRQGAGDEFLATLDENGKRTARTDSLVNYHSLVGDFQKRDNIRIRELSLSYMIPDGLTGGFGLGRTTLTLAGSNLTWWDDCQCADPNMQYAPGGSSGNNFSGFLAMPAARRFLLSVRTSF